MPSSTNLLKAIWEQHANCENVETFNNMTNLNTQKEDMSTAPSSKSFKYKQEIKKDYYYYNRFKQVIRFNRFYN